MTPLANPLLIQIVPRLVPGGCGISDHAILLARELESAFAVKSAFVVLSSNVTAGLPFAVTTCDQAELLEVCRSLAPDGSGDMLVHLTGYGYSPDGVPAALAAALGRVRASGRFRIAVYFHELFASGPPWSSAFWQLRRQKHAVRSISAACHLALTNTRRHAQLLEREGALLPGSRVRVLNMFSQIGEAENPVAADRRDPAMIIFGLGATRQGAYRQLANRGSTLRDLAIEELWDIGPGMKPPAQLDGIPVKHFGPLAAQEIAAHLERARFGFVWHSPDSLGKSGVFAAYCANGAVPVISMSFAAEFDGLRDGIHLLSPKTAASAQTLGLNQCSMAARRWYSAHSLRVHAETYQKWLAENPSREEPAWHAAVSPQA
jgi:hypothetical protein